MVHYAYVDVYMHVYMCTQLTKLQLSCADIPSIKSSKGLLHNTVHTTPCHTKLSSVNLKSTCNTVQFKYFCNTEGLVTAVMVLSPLYLPMDCNIRAPSTTSEVSTVAYDDIMTLNTLCEFHGLCSERELLFVA